MLFTILLWKHRTINKPTYNNNINKEYNALTFIIYFNHFSLLILVNATEEYVKKKVN